MLIDEVPYSTKNYRYQQQLGYWRDELYVNPDTGILCVAKKPPRKPPQKRDDLVIVDRYHHYRKLNDIWYAIALQDLPATEPVTDVVMKVTLCRSTSWHTARQEYGREVYAASKRQCNKKEIKFILKQLNKH